jgi:hypothetical protein
MGNNLIIETLKRTAMDQFAGFNSPIESGDGRPRNQGILNAVLTRVAENTGAIASSTTESASSGGNTLMDRVVSAMTAGEGSTAALPQRRIVSSADRESQGPMTVVDTAKLGRDIIAASKKPQTRVGAAIEAAFGIGNNYVEALGTAGANRVGRLMRADLVPEDYLSDPARQALGIVATRTAELTAQLSAPDFEKRAKDYAQRALADKKGAMAARDYLVESDGELRDSEQRLARKIAIQVIRREESSLTDPQITSLVQAEVTQANLHLANGVFSRSYTQAKKAQLGIEIKRKLNPSDEKRIPVMRIKPTQLAWSAALGDPTKVKDAIIPALTPNERGVTGISIEIDPKTGDIYVLRGGGAVDTSVWPAADTNIQWVQTDRQAIVSDSKLFRRVRKWMGFRGNNMEVGQIMIENQKKRKSTLIPIIVRFPDSDDYSLEKPAEGGGYALALGLAGLKEAFQFSGNAIKTVAQNGNGNVFSTGVGEGLSRLRRALAGDPVDQDGIDAYALDLTKTELLKERYRPRLLVKRVKELVEQVKQSIESDRELVEAWQEESAQYITNREVLLSIKEERAAWIKNEIDALGRPPSAEDRKRLSDEYDRQFMAEAMTIKSLVTWMRVNSRAYVEAFEGIEFVQQGQIALLEEVGLGEFKEE